MNYNNEDEKREHAPPILGKPGASFKRTSAFGRPPAFSKAAGSLMEKIKNLSKKDLAFVAVGLGVLITAPVAEYMMSKPGGADQLTPGFGSRGNANSSLYEPGINSLAQGSPDGTGEVVTLLSSRDPASLILGSEPSQPPAAPQQAPRTDFRDSMKDSARNAFSEATKAAGVPTVIPKMQSSLRAMGSFFSGGEGTRTTGLGGDKVLASAKNASGKAAARSMVGPVGGAGYRGVSNSPNSADKGAFDKLRGQADKAAGNFSGESSIRSLDKAAADSVDLAKNAGGMSNTDGDKFTRPTNSSVSDKKNSSRGPETLEEAAAKARQAKALEWEFFKKYDIPKKIIEAMLTGFTGSLTKWIGGMTDDMTGQSPGPGPAPKFCWKPADGTMDPKNCKNGEMIVFALSDCSKDKGINCDIDSNTCPCGVHAKGTTGGGTTPGGTTPGGTTPGGTTPGGTTPGGTTPGGNTVPPGFTETLGQYDTALTELVDNARNGETATEAKMLLQYTKASADSITKCAGFAKTLYGDVKGKTPKLVNAEKTPYHTAILAAETKIAGARNKYDTFVGKVDAQIAKLESGTRAQVGDAEVVQTGSGVTPLALLKAVKAQADDHQKIFIAVAEAKLKFHKGAESFYDTQSGLVTGKAGDMSGEVAETSGKVAEVIAGLKDITEETAALPDNVTKIKDAFSKLTGKTCAVPDAPVAQTVDPAVVPPSPEEPPAEGGDEAYMAEPIAWRGADADKLWNEKKVDDSAVKKTEADAWAAASPLKKLEAREIDGALGSVEAEDDLITLAIRGETVLPADIKGANGYTAEMTTGGVELLESSIAGWTTQLADAGVKLDGDTGTVAPTPSGDTLAAADKSRIMDSARDVPALHTAAAGTMATLNANKSTNAAFKTARNNAGAQFDIMQNRQSSIAALKAEIEADPKKATTAQYKRLEGLVAEYNLAKKGNGTPQNLGFDVYAEQANAAGKPYVKPVKPGPSTVIHVEGGHGGNATAIADAHSGSTSGVTLKPPVNPVIVPPVILQAPGSFNVGGVNFLPTGGLAGEVVSYTSRLVNISSLAKPYYTINCVRAGKWFNTSGCQKHGAVYGSEACPSLDNKSCGPVPSK